MAKTIKRTWNKMTQKQRAGFIAAFNGDNDDYSEACFDTDNEFLGDSIDALIPFVIETIKHENKIKVLATPVGAVSGPRDSLTDRMAEASLPAIFPHNITCVLYTF